MRYLGFLIAALLFAALLWAQSFPAGVESLKPIGQSAADCAAAQPPVAGQNSICATKTGYLFSIDGGSYTNAPFAQLTCTVKNNGNGTITFSKCF